MSTPLVATPKKTWEQQFADARAITDSLFGILEREALYERPIPERHRIVFYIGHLEAFDWNLLRRGRPELNSPSPELDKLFAFGIDPVGGGLPIDQPGDWPNLRDIRKYVDTTRQAVDSVIEEGRFDLSSEDAGYSPDTLFHVAVEHRLMHAETLAYMFHQLPYEIKHQQIQSDLRSSQARPSGAHLRQMVEIPAGAATLGLSSSNSCPFGWDNEYKAHEEEVPGFLIDKFMVTNGQFLEFLEAGGYGERRYWQDEDWNWIQQQHIAHPVFWNGDGQQWLYRGMFEKRPLPLDWPVYVSQAEARAYAEWAGKTLPTEAEWHRAAYGGKVRAEEAKYPWGTQIPDQTAGNFDFARWDPAAVDAFPHNASSFGVVGMLGNGWEWTSTPFAPFPGFRPFPFYAGYSANFFDGKHFVMKGGSSRTAACMLRRSFRNWFQPHYQYVYAGFRCVSN